MFAKDKKDDILISQQWDLIKSNHKNINKIESIHFDQKRERQVIITEYYDKNLTTRQNNETITGI